MSRAARQFMTDEEAETFLKSLVVRHDSEAAIVAAAYVEDRLGFAIKSSFVKLPPTENASKQLTEAALFSGYGPLSTFNAKIDIGYALGLYNIAVRQHLHIIRSIRNEFSHTLESLRFTDQLIAQKCDRLSLYRDRERTKSIVAKLDSENLAILKNKIIFLVTCTYISARIDVMGEVRASILPL